MLVFENFPVSKDSRTSFSFVCSNICCQRTVKHPFVAKLNIIMSNATVILTSYLFLFRPIINNIYLFINNHSLFFHFMLILMCFTLAYALLSQLKKKKKKKLIICTLA